MKQTTITIKDANFSCTINLEGKVPNSQIQNVEAWFKSIINFGLGSIYSDRFPEIREKIESIIAEELFDESFPP